MIGSDRVEREAAKPFCLKGGVLSLFAAAWLLSGCRNNQDSQPGPSVPPANATSVTPSFLPDGPTEREYPELHRLLQVTDQIYSGGEPKTEAAFASLATLGVTTIVSVDGARPNVELAHKHGLQYVHIPIGYDGIEDHAARALTRVVRNHTGPLYIHCHHGRHRGPAAAAVACVASGAASGEEALEVLRRAGTGANYTGLWRDVKGFTPPGPTDPLPDLVSVAEVPSLAAAMAQVDRASDNLKLLAANRWQPPADHPDLVAATEATLLHEGFREAVRLLPNGYDEQFIAWLKESVATSEQFAAAIGQDSGDELWTTLQAQCTRCHQAYRD